MSAGMGFVKLAPPLHAAVTGTNVSPGIFEVLELLGRELTLARICRVPGVGCPQPARREIADMPPSSARAS